VVFDIDEYIIMEWTMESKPDMQDMQEGVYPKKMKKSVADQFAAVKYRSDTYCWTQN